jgi:hypothetical protein
LLTRANEYLIDTDVLEEHLIHISDKSNSYLELLMQKGICFSTVLNVSELLYKADSIIEQKIVEDLLSSIKILGLHSRYSLLVPKYSIKVKNINDALFCVVADYNKLPIVTLKKSKYVKSGLLIYHPKEIMS